MGDVIYGWPPRPIIAREIGAFYGWAYAYAQYNLHQKSAILSNFYLVLVKKKFFTNLFLEEKLFSIDFESH